MRQLVLPSTYNGRGEGTVPDKFKKYIGRPCLSYSSYTSFNEEVYLGEFLGNKFLGTPREGSIFTEFGSSVGVYLETGQPQDYLSDFDMSVLDKEYPANSNAEYEREIVIDRGSYVILGFIDKNVFLDSRKVQIRDYKTGSIEKKKKDYASPDYNQTTMYSYALEEEGYEIESSGVILFDRKGNTLEQGNKNVLRLTGEIEYIYTPYSRERAEKFLKKMDETALEIEKWYAIYNKYFK